MCPPEWYGVDYVLNPMDGRATSTAPPAISPSPSGRACTTSSAASPTSVCSIPSPAVPDMVYPRPCCAWCSHGVAADLQLRIQPSAAPKPPTCAAGSPARASSSGRRPARLAFEGRRRHLCFNDSGTSALGRPRSAHLQAPRIAMSPTRGTFPVTSLHLVRSALLPPRHLLHTAGNGGYLLYYPAAFDAPSQAQPSSAALPSRQAHCRHRSSTPPAWPARALNLGRTVFTGEISRELAARLFDAGLRRRPARARRVYQRRRRREGPRPPPERSPHHPPPHRPRIADTADSRRPCNSWHIRQRLQGPSSFRLHFS
jgi:hypothetical protein